MVLVRKGLNQGFRRKGIGTGNYSVKSRGERESLTHQGNKEALSTMDELLIRFNDEEVTLFIKSIEMEKKFLTIDDAKRNADFIAFKLYNNERI